MHSLVCIDCNQGMRLLGKRLRLPEQSLQQGNNNTGINCKDNDCSHYPHESECPLCPYHQNDKPIEAPEDKPHPCKNTECVVQHIVEV